MRGARRGLDTDTKRLVRLFLQPALVAWALGATARDGLVAPAALAHGSYPAFAGPRWSFLASAPPLLPVSPVRIQSARNGDAGESPQFRGRRRVPVARRLNTAPIGGDTCGDGKRRRGQRFVDTVTVNFVSRAT